MRFVNRNAYIMCAVKGGNFCTSAKDAFRLLMRNIARLVRPVKMSFQPLTAVRAYSLLKPWLNRSKC